MTEADILEKKGKELSDKTGLTVIFWYTYSVVDDKPQDDRTYYSVVKDQIDAAESTIYFRYSSDNLEKTYKTTKKALKLLEYKV